MIGQHHTGCSDTELAGAAAIAPSAETIKARVKLIFERRGPLTDCELKARYEAIYGAIDVNSLQPRRYELKIEGWLEDSGERRKGSSGVNRTVWQKVVHAPEQLSLLEGSTV